MPGMKRPPLKAAWRDGFAAALRTASLALVLVAAAQAQNPPKLEPLPDVPPPPAGSKAQEEDFDSAVRIRKERGDKVEVAKRGNQVVAIKVTPANGAPPYYLIDRQGNGKFALYDGPISGLVFPSWTILEW